MSNSSSQLKRGLKNRHIQLIAMGGAVGTGLFRLCTSHSVCWSFNHFGLCHCWFGCILIMRQMGEMIVEEPVVGSFSYFAQKYWGRFPGFYRAGTIGLCTF